MPNNQDWVTFCPPEIRDKLRKMLDYPPGTPDSEKIYNYVFIDEFADPNYVGHTDPDAITPDKIKDYRKFAAAWGKYAEALTARHLLCKGFPIREWNWRPPGKGRGEIDLITQHGNRIIFVEVKARCGKHTDPWDAIDEKKRRDLCRGADIYLRMQREDYEYQFDVALLTGDCYNYEFEYIEDAFLAPLSLFK